MITLEEAYRILEISSNTTYEEIESKFKELAKRYHPDNLDTGDNVKMQNLNEAKNVIDRKFAENNLLPAKLLTELMIESQRQIQSYFSEADKKREADKERQDEYDIFIKRILTNKLSTYQASINTNGFFTVILAILAFTGGKPLLELMSFISPSFKKEGFDSVISIYLGVMAGCFGIMAANYKAKSDNIKYAVETVNGYLGSKKILSFFWKKIAQRIDNWDENIKENPLNQIIKEIFQKEFKLGNYRANYSSPFNLLISLSRNKKELNGVQLILESYKIIGSVDFNRIFIEKSILKEYLIEVDNEEEIFSKTYRLHLD